LYLLAVFDNFEVTKGNMMIKSIQLWVGIIGMVLFLLSGQYFALMMNGLQDLADAPRLLLRSSHVYFFFGCFINIIFGLYYVEPKRLRWYFNANQSLIIASPFLLAYGFMFESLNAPDIDRAIGIQGAIILFAWLVTTAIGKLIVRFKRP
jgi:hypothetical protein